MAYENEVFSLMEKLVIADKHIVASLMPQWKSGTSAVNNADKSLNANVALGRLAKGKGKRCAYYKLPDCKSNYEEHSQLLTQALAEILKLNFQTKIFREKTITEIGLRPDAIVDIEHDGKALVFIVEVVNNEPQNYLVSKIHAWQSFDGAKEYLSYLFGIKVKAFDIVVDGGQADGAFEFNAYLKEVQNVWISND